MESLHNGTGKRAGAGRAMSAMLCPASDGDGTLCLRARLHLVHHHLGFLTLEEPGANQRGGTFGRFALSRHGVLGAELAQGLIAGPTQPVAEGVRLL